jgi:RHS repeat-associated protein
MMPPPTTYDYLPFGKPYAPGMSVGVSQRYTYTGREVDPAGAMMYYRYREYDARLGRFAGRDPAGTDANPLANLAVAFDNSPAEYSDPYGLAWSYIDPPKAEEAPWSYARLRVSGVLQSGITRGTVMPLVADVFCSCYCCDNGRWAFECGVWLVLHIYIRKGGLRRTHRNVAMSSGMCGTSSPKPNASRRRTWPTGKRRTHARCGLRQAATDRRTGQREISTRS